MTEKEDNRYDLDLRRHVSHRKSFPRSLVLKIGLGVALLFLLYYLANQLIDIAAETSPVNESEVEKAGNQY